MEMSQSLPVVGFRNDHPLFVSRSAKSVDMCFDLSSRPPIEAAVGCAVTHGRPDLRSADGTVISAFEALAGRTPSPAAILVLPDVRGLHTYYEELALRFAEAGLDALAIDYFGRTAGASERGPDFPVEEHITRVRWAYLRNDVSAAVRYLHQRAAGRALFSIGFCFGGRLSLLAGALGPPELTGSIGLYGYPVGPAKYGDLPAPADVATQMRGAVLALFGGADPTISAADIATFERALVEADVPHETHTYPDAPHSFFDRQADEYSGYSKDAWRRILDFVGAPDVEFRTS